MTIRRMMLVGLVLGGLVLAVAGCARNSGTANATSQAQPAGLPVEVARARITPMSREYVLTGTIKARTDATVSAAYPARVTGVYVREGDRVTAGQVLVRMDDDAAQARLQQALGALSAAQSQVASAQSAYAAERVTSPSRLQEAQAGLAAAQSRLAALRAGARSQERAVAQSAVTAAKSSLDKAAADLARAETLYQQGAIAQQQLDSARNAHQLAQSQYRSAQQQLSLVREGARAEDISAAEAAVRQARAAVAAARAGLRSVDISRLAAQSALANQQQAQAAVDAAREDLANTVVRAPISGVVYARMVDVGVLPGVGNPLLQIADLRRVYFEATVPARDFAALAAGQPVNVSVDALAGESFAGRLERIVPVASPESRDFLARIAIENPSLQLRPGMFARGSVQVERHESAIVVPNEALIGDPGRQRVFVVSGDKAVSRNVTTGLETATLTEIVSGVRAGEEVITAGQQGLQSGQQVNITRRQ